MKRNMDLIRLILLNVEGEESVDLSAYNGEQVNYHTKLLYDAGFIDGVDASTISGWEILDPTLTWEGHDFLDVARNENVWSESMRQIGKGIGTASLDVIKTVLAAVATQMLTGGRP
jgi:hypothetical protein